ncbi:60S ribosomal export protein nmd3, partial [Achlya hypogyna]
MYYSRVDKPWKALVQIRQDDLTALCTAQLHRVLAATDMYALHQVTTKSGIDLYFGDHAHGRSVVAELMASWPCRVKTTRTTVTPELVRQTHLVELCGLKRHDLVVLRNEVAKKLNLPRVVVVTDVGHGIHLVDPLTGDTGIMTTAMYWRTPVEPIRSGREQYIVLDIEPVDVDYSEPGRRDETVVDLEVVRVQDLGCNDTRFRAQSHLGKDVSVGDKVYGYDLVPMVHASKRHGMCLLTKDDLPDV